MPLKYDKPNYSMDDLLDFIRELDQKFEEMNERLTTANQFVIDELIEIGEAIDSIKTRLDALESR